MKRCKKCGLAKPLKDFPDDRNRPDRKFPYCLECHRQYQAARIAAEGPEERAARKALERARYWEWRKADLEGSGAIIRAKAQLRRYGLTPDDYSAMLDAQGGTCALAHCDQTPTDDRHGRLHVDHDHVTGAIRGLVCFAHNAMLGHAKDDATALADGIAYLADPPAAKVLKRN